MNNRGMTLLEVMMALAIMTLVVGAIFGISLSLSDTAIVQNVKVSNTDEARRALQVVVPLLRQASSQSINWAELPGQSITFRGAADVSGNGTAVDLAGNLELGPERRIGRDVDDLNGDGLTVEQLVLVEGETVRVLANNLSPLSEIANAAGGVDAANDVNNNGRLDRGFWVEPAPGGLRIFIQTEGETRLGQVIATRISEFVAIRNN